MTATILGSSNPTCRDRGVARGRPARRSARRSPDLRARMGNRRRSARGGSPCRASGERRGRRGQGASRSIRCRPTRSRGSPAPPHARGDHAAAARSLRAAARSRACRSTSAAQHELELARSLIALGRTDDARASLRRATLAGGETAPRHMRCSPRSPRRRSIASTRPPSSTPRSRRSSSSRRGATGGNDRLYTRAAELAASRVPCCGSAVVTTRPRPRTGSVRTRSPSAALADDRPRCGAHDARARADDASAERRWIDAVLATSPPPIERAALLVRRADVRRRERTPDLAAAIADLHDALAPTWRACPGCWRSSTGEHLAAELEADAAVETRRHAYQLEAEVLAQSGDQRARAQALTALAQLAERDRGSHRGRDRRRRRVARRRRARRRPAPRRARARLDGASAPTCRRALRREVLTHARRGRVAPACVARRDPRVSRASIDEPRRRGPAARHVPLPARGRRRSHRRSAARGRGRCARSSTTTRTPRDAGTQPRAPRPGAAPVRRPRGARGRPRGGCDRARGLRVVAVRRLAERARGRDVPRGRAVPPRRARRRRRSAASRPRCGSRRPTCPRSMRSSTHGASAATSSASRDPRPQGRGDGAPPAAPEAAAVAARRSAGSARPPRRRAGDAPARARDRSRWRPSLRYVTSRLREAGQLVAAAGGFAQLAGELPGDAGVDLAIVARERQHRGAALVVARRGAR